MKVHGQFRVVADIPERLPFVGSQIRQTDAVRVAAHHDPLESHLGGAVDLLDTLLDIPPGHERHREQPAVRIRLDLRHRIVVDLRAGESQVVVLDLHEVLASKASDIWIQDLRIEAESIQHSDTCPHVIRGNMHVFDLPAEEFHPARLLTIFSNHTRGRRVRDLYISIDDPGALITRPNDPRHPVLERCGRARSPQVMGLGDMGVDIDNRQRLCHPGDIRSAHACSSEEFR